MGRIADSALALLADGPLDADRLGEALAATGATRSRDPAGAVRRAIRDDPRVIQIADGRFASIAQALTGVCLTTVVSDDEAAAGELDVDPDLAPLALVDAGPTVPLPAGASAGDTMMIPEAAAALQHVATAKGPFDFAVGYSMGAAILLVAMVRGLQTARVGFIAPPINYPEQLTLSARGAGAPAPLVSAAPWPRAWRRHARSSWPARTTCSTPTTAAGSQPRGADPCCWRIPRRRTARSCAAPSRSKRSAPSQDQHDGLQAVVGGP